MFGTHFIWETHLMTSYFLPIMMSCFPQLNRFLVSLSSKCFGSSHSGNEYPSCPPSWYPNTWPLRPNCLDNSTQLDSRIDIGSCGLVALGVASLTSYQEGESVSRIIDGTTACHLTPG